MKYVIFVITLLIFLSSCRVTDNAIDRNSNSLKPTESSKVFSQINVTEKPGHPDIDISNYTVITDNAETHLKEAKAVMQVKKNYPLAMRTKNRDLFERILARNFTFRGQNDFFSRVDYINNRVEGEITDWSVKYENIVLQFIDQNALVSYRNIVKGKDASGKPNYTEYMTWADIYVKENGEWKIGAVHLIDYREEIH